MLRTRSYGTAAREVAEQFRDKRSTSTTRPKWARWWPGTDDGPHDYSIPDQFRSAVSIERPDSRHAHRGDIAVTVTLDDSQQDYIADQARSVFARTREPGVIYEIAYGGRKPVRVGSYELQHDEIASLAVLLATETDLAAGIAHFAKVNKHDPDTRYRCGVMHDQSGHTGEALRWFRRSARDGSLAMRLLAAPLPATVAPTPSWSRRATAAMGCLWLTAGDLGPASKAFDRAADAGEPLGHFGSGAIDLLQGNLGPAERKLRHAADAGQVEAMHCLAKLWSSRFELEQAEHLLRAAIETGYFDAVTALAAILLKRDDTDEALALLESGAQRASVGAMAMLGATLIELDRPQRGHWWRRQAEYWWGVHEVYYPAKTLRLWASVALADIQK